MPKNKVSDPITDQEIAFARLVLSGAMTDRQAAEAVGLNPDSAAYTKSKPRVRAYMLEHRAAVQQQLVQQGSRGTAPAEPGPRTSTGPPLGNRQPQPRDDPRQHYRPGQGPLDDRGHAKPHPRPPRQVFGEEILRLRPSPRKSMPPPARPGLPWGLTRKKIRLPSPPVPPVPACRGASRGSPSSFPARRERRLRTLAPASPPSSTPFALRNHRLWPLTSPSALLFQTWEWVSL